MAFKPIINLNAYPLNVWKIFGLVMLGVDISIEAGYY